MIIELNMQSEEPIYTQLIHQVIEGIASGQLQPGEPLPSVRSMASDIGVNLHTVNKAYNLLKQGGFIQIHRQRGVVVDPDGVPAATDSDRARQQQQLRPIIAEAICRGMKEAELIHAVQSIYRNIVSGTKEREL
ncbi:GntR family transcriptional regulator [Paenibacillus sp. JX-17]|uniref:GntR family transcriptional regulator n=1 Tax=Paenibacillus lacisoli TaxID=3064525 RepID=A0ABT9CE78_9BACL|nr:GntR family transcriptional regulator [Paenibacillus sp. JX-17]MDO7905908.1 GntR family transcriptional regulator [Paenibacillus sp. JX-17]